MAEKQAKLRTKLLGDSDVIQQENDADKKVVDAFEANKKKQQDKRLRNIELEKKKLHNAYESEVKDKFGDFDEMKRRKEKAQEEQKLEAEHLRELIAEQKKKLKQQAEVAGMTDAEKAKLLGNLENQYKALDSAYLMEQRRQGLELRRRQEQRKKKLEAMAAAKEKELAKRAVKEEGASANAMTKGLRGMFKKAGTLILEDNENSELMRKLRAWKVAKKNLENEKLRSHLEEASPDMDEAEIRVMVLKLKQT